MKNLFFFLSISFLIFSCSDDKRVIDLSLKSDLIVSQYIKGKMAIAETLVPDDINKITLDNVQSILVSNCLNEFSDNGVFYNIAQGFSCSSPVGRQKVNTEQHKETFDFRDHVCTQALYLCVGYKFLELAELQNDTTIAGVGVETDTVSVPFTENNHFTNYLLYNSNNELVYRQSYTVINNSTSSTVPCLSLSGGPTVCHFNITMGPQEPHIRTWLYQAARDAFERAGIAGGQVLFGDGLNAVTAISQKKAFSEPPTFAEQFAVEYFEVLERYTETVEKLAKHQAAVG